RTLPESPTTRTVIRSAARERRTSSLCSFQSTLDLSICTVSGGSEGVARAEAGAAGAGREGPGSSAAGSPPAVPPPALRRGASAAAKNRAPSAECARERRGRMRCREALGRVRFGFRSSPGGARGRGRAIAGRPAFLDEREPHVVIEAVLGPGELAGRARGDDR